MVVIVNRVCCDECGRFLIHKKEFDEKLLNDPKDCWYEGETGEDLRYHVNRSCKVTCEWCMEESVAASALTKCDLCERHYHVGALTPTQVGQIPNRLLICDRCLKTGSTTTTLEMIKCEVCRKSALPVYGEGFRRLTIGVPGKFVCSTECMRGYPDTVIRTTELEEARRDRPVIWKPRKSKL